MTGHDPSPGRPRLRTFDAPLREPGGLGATVSKLVAIIRVTLASRLTYLGEFVTRTIFLGLILYTFTQLWSATNRSQDVTALTGFSIAQLIWYLAFTEAIVLSGPSVGEVGVDREVRSGELAYRLARPIAYPLFHLGTYLGERLVRFGLNLAIGCAVAALVVGGVPLSPIGVAAALAAALLAFVVDWLWTFSVSLTSFWIEDTFGLHLLLRRFIMLLGGLMIPLDAYPEWLERVARALPFQYILYQPSRLFLSTDASGAPSVFAMQALFGGVGLVLLLAIYSRGSRRVSAQGG